MTLSLNFLICEIELISSFSWESDESQKDKVCKAPSILGTQKMFNIQNYFDY